MVNLKTIQKDISQRKEELIQLQHIDGSWRFLFQGSLMTDAFFIITCRALNITDYEETIVKLVNTLKKTQTNKGYWKAYKDETNGNLSSTVIAYTALLYSGYCKKEDKKMQQARSYIIAHGGLEKCHFMIRWMLSVNGMYPWSNMIYIPMTFLLLPTYQPINFFQFSSYARIHFIPMLIVSNKKYTITNDNTPNLKDLFPNNPNYSLPLLELEDNRSPLSFFWKEIKKAGALPVYMHNLGYIYAEKYILDRIEEDGTLYSYASATFFMIYGLLAQGYNKNSIMIKKAISGLFSLIKSNENNTHLENSTSTIWDTALICYSLQEAQLPSDSKTIKNAVTYLLDKQHTKKADWSIHNPHTLPGGWGFSAINTNNPDNDDTSAVLRALKPTAANNHSVYYAWKTGVNYLLSMQNRDGGWGAFEKNTNWELLQYVPIENAKDAAVDPSTADLTGRILEFLGNFADFNHSHSKVKRGINWLYSNQNKDGSWYGRWGVCYIYGTWAAITGLRAVGINQKDKSIKKAIQWLKTIQREDGGWGESCQSCEKLRYIPLSFSTDSQTAWAVDALIAAGEGKSDTVIKGINYLLKKNKEQKSILYPTGIGLPTQFYIYYESYNKIFPLLALSHFYKNISENL
ncbi:squalene--hopene cyclase [Niallia sp. NCCP-28]|uniref:squalene--hopene cyclase n=1 Tax=Niallia sp. NCCP-28 TaxID=2934712 RepID=UPI0020815DD1|nr:squalene--hopene cyclase [Niallia sp. NCCP-28]GKU84586.1 sporulenol synthase [Niallia sp. NCCP-28]